MNYLNYIFDCFYPIEHTFYGDSNNIKTKRFVTFYNLRLDSMAELNIDENSFITTFNDRSVFYIFSKNSR